MTKIIKNRWYRPSEIVELGFVVNSRNNPSLDFVLDLIKSGKLVAQNYSTTDIPRYRVLGQSIIDYKEAHEGIKAN